GAGRNQHGAAVSDISGDVLEIDVWQNALPRVAVENDELEVVDPLLEQFAGRKRDQGQFVDRRSILLLGRSQDGEVDKVDIGVGFEQVAPGALARVRLAGYQQHPQLVAHPVDRHDGTVVDGRQLALERRRLDFDDVLPRVGNLDLNVDLAT